jgi:hypothetical protein
MRVVGIIRQKETINDAKTFRDVIAFNHRP